MGIGVLLVLLNTIGWLGPVRSLAAMVSKPFQVTFSGAGNAVSDWFQVIGDARRLGAENQRLRAEVAALRQRVSQDTEIRAQNDALRKQLGGGVIAPDRLVAAEVLSYQP